MTGAPFTFVVAVALINDEGQILLGQRPEGKALENLWEFPGGKLEPGETPEAALVRELHEELGIMVKQSSLSPLTFVSYSYASFHLFMPLYKCREWKGDLRPIEHQALEWVNKEELLDRPAPEADIPLFEFLRDWQG